MADTLQRSRMTPTRGRGAYRPPPMPRIAQLCPKLSKAFPEDIKALQLGLDQWFGQVEAQTRNSLDSQSTTGG